MKIVICVTYKNLLLTLSIKYIKRNSSVTIWEPLHACTWYRSFQSHRTIYLRGCNRMIHFPSCQLSEREYCPRFDWSPVHWLDFAGEWSESNILRPISRYSLSVIGSSSTGYWSKFWWPSFYYWTLILSSWTSLQVYQLSMTWDCLDPPLWIQRLNSSSMYQSW